jgi:hypothetical protein
MPRPPSVDFKKRIEKELWPILVHESGHALMAFVQGVPCYGIAFEKQEGSGRFCSLVPPVALDQLSRAVLYDVDENIVEFNRSVPPPPRE